MTWQALSISPYDVVNLMPSTPDTRGMLTGKGLTLVHYSAQRKHVLWDTLGA